MVSFISGVLLREEPGWKSMLKHDFKIFFQQFTKTFKTCYQQNTIQRNFVMRHYFWLEQLNVCAKYWFLSDKYIHFTGKCCTNAYWPTDVVHSLIAMGVSKLFILVYHLQDWLMLSLLSIQYFTNLLWYLQDC